MTLPWSKLPRSLAGDPRWCLLSLEAACAYTTARLIADDAGAVWGVGSRDALETLAEMVASRRAGDPQWALSAVAECVDVGLLEDHGNALRVVDWIDGPANDRPAPATTAEASAPVATSSAAGEASRAKSSTERGDRLRFKRRKGRYATVPAGVSYEDREAFAVADNAQATGGNGDNDNDNGEATETTATTTAPVASRAVSETSVVSDEFGEKREEKESRTRAGEASRNGLTTVGNGGEATETTLRPVVVASVAVAPAALFPADAPKSRAAEKAQRKLDLEKRRADKLETQRLLAEAKARTKAEKDAADARREASNPRLPFRAWAALQAIEASSAGQFVAGEERDVGSYAMPVEKHIRVYGDLEDWTRLGRWLAYGDHTYRSALGVAWAASGALRDAMARARAWDAAANDPTKSGIRDLPRRPSVDDEAADLTATYDRARAEYHATPQGAR